MTFILHGLLQPQGWHRPETARNIKMKHSRNKFSKAALRGYACLAGLLWWGCVLAQDAPDPYIGMENLQDPNATRWVDEQSMRTLESVRKMPGFDERYKANLRVLSQREFNIQMPGSVDGVVYNHFRTASQPKGVWRQATMDEYRKSRP
ncbi:MAG: hypothetical protein M3Q12_11325, partial [Pseudomonadota bacterium]|nr:hypothetical protein [Pseudomonadota bacterium]